jgi:GTPase
MRFIDEVSIVVESGKGGDGCASFLRDRNTAFGGPNGGDGGRGGDVVLTATTRYTTLSSLRTRPLWKADNGTPGQSRQCAGAKGKPLEIFVPVGTRVFHVETDVVLADLTEDEQSVVIAQGGGGGIGNIHFKTSTNRTPRKFTFGKPGEHLPLRLELMVMADVGLLGYPNAGKSSLISQVSAAKPKVAGYPFTTLAPKLGVVDMGIEGSFTIADIPGLIEGAADGHGLGHQFLRHVQRTKTLLHLLSLGPDESLDIVERYQNIRAELEKYDPELAQKPEVIVLTKLDLVDEEELEIVLDLLRDVVGKRKILRCSSITGDGVNKVTKYVWRKLLGNR